MPKITLLHFSFKHFTAGKLRVVILYVCLRIENTFWNYYTFSNQFIQGFTTVPVRTLICSLQILSHFFYEFLVVLMILPMAFFKNALVHTSGIQIESSPSVQG